MAVYKPNAVFAYKVSSTDFRDAEMDLPFVESFVDMLNSRDCVFDIGCGKNHYSTNEIAMLCKSRGVEATIVGVDPALALANDTQIYTKRYGTDFLAMDYRKVLGITEFNNRKGKTIGRQIIDDAIKLDARVIASAFDQDTMESLSSQDEIVEALKLAGYLVEKFDETHIIAKKSTFDRKVARHEDESFSFITDGLDRRDKEFLEYQLERSRYC